MSAKVSRLRRLAEPSRVKQRPAVRRHGVRLSRRGIQQLLKRLQPPRQLAVLLHDLLVAPLEEVDVLGRFGEDGALEVVCQPVPIISPNVIPARNRPPITHRGSQTS